MDREHTELSTDCRPAAKGPTLGASPRRTRHHIFSILLVFGSLILSWGICEGVLRAYQTVLLNSLEAEVSDVLYFDPGRIGGVQYQLKPNLTLRYHTNAAGWRGPLLLDGPAPPRERRIAIVGDSIAFGLGIYADRQTYAGQLETLLNEASAHGDISPGISYRVYNFGVPGYTAWDIHAVSDHLVRRYHVDWIVYVFCFNDFVTPYMVDQRGLLVNPEQEYDDGESIKQWLKRSLFVRVVVNTLRPMANRLFTLERTDRYSSQPRWTAMKDELRAMVTDIQRPHVSMATVIIPLGYHITFAPGVPVLEHQEIETLFHSLGVPTVGVLDDYRAMNPKQVFPFGLLDGHPSQDAVAVAVHRLFTEVLQPHFANKTSGEANLVRAAPGGKAAISSPDRDNARSPT